MKKKCCFAVCLLAAAGPVFSQGCIPVRNISGFGQYHLLDNSYSTSPWQLNLTNRYFRSYRDFREGTDLKTPPKNESVNSVYTFDILLSRMFRNGWSLAFNLPITSNVRTSSVEHGGLNTPRHSTSSFGAGDLRLTVYKWIREPARDQLWNLQVGLGLKFATGDYRYQDYFYRNDSTKVLSAVNPSIQLGDGGTGFTGELNGFLKLNQMISLFGDVYYLLNPRDENGTLYTTGRTPTPLQIAADAMNNSVPDVYSLHAGAYFSWNDFSFSAAVRKDGTPVHDLVGGSDGARRAGYYLSVEPGVIYKFRKMTLYSYVPVVIKRRVYQTVPEKSMSRITGTKMMGAGGSADAVFYLGAGFQL